MTTQTAITGETLESKLREKIRDSISDIVPQEEWDKMIKEEVEAFFTRPLSVKKTVTDGGRSYGRYPKEETHYEYDLPSGFAGVVHGEMIKKAKTYCASKVTHLLDDTENTHVTEMADAAIKKAVTTVVGENLMKMLSIAMGSVISNTAAGVLSDAVAKMQVAEGGA